LVAPDETKPEKPVEAPRWLYRSRQFFSALLGRVTKEEMDEARGVLGPRLYGVFAAMPGQYRHHMLAVYRRVREAGCDDPHVWQAALLHDSGKFDPITGKYVSLAYRVAIVLLKVTGPGRRVLRRLEEPLNFGGPGGTPWPRGHQNPKSRRGWRYPFYLSRHHAELGARLAEEHAADRRVVGLIAAHHDRETPDRSLAALQAADEKS
jgi:hypothetical protein